MQAATGTPGIKTDLASQLFLPWSSYPCVFPSSDEMELHVLLSSSQSCAGLTRIVLLLAMAATFFLSLHPSQEQTQLSIFVWKSFVQVLACCCFDPKSKLFFFPS